MHIFHIDYAVQINRVRAVVLLHSLGCSQWQVIDGILDEGVADARDRPGLIQKNKCCGILSAGLRRVLFTASPTRPGELSARS